MNEKVITLTEADAVEFLFDISGKRSMRVHAKIEEQLRSQLSPQYDRQQVLWEEWEPKVGEPFCFIFADNTISILGIFEHSRSKEFGWVFAPTEDLAAEIVKIREGKWLPKMGDEVYEIFRDGTPIGDKQIKKNDSSWEDFYASGRRYFPSEAQRIRFIESQKQETMEKKDDYRFWRIGEEIVLVNDDDIFFNDDGTLYCEDGTLVKTGATTELNRMRTELSSLARRVKELEGK